MSVSRRTPRSWHVSQGFTLSKNNNKSGISGLRLVHTLDTAGKAYYSQLWKLDTHSWQRDYATGYCHRRRREQAIAQHSILRERYRAAKKNLTAVLYDLTNAFAWGAQESQAGELAPLADVVRAEVQNLTAREHLCQRLAGAQLRLDCADGSWRPRLEAAHSQVTQWQAVGFYNISFQNLMRSYKRHLSFKLTRLCLLTYQTFLSLLMWAHQHMQTTSFEKFPGSLQKMSSQESIAPTMLSTLLWHLIMFKTVENKRYFLTSLVAGHTRRVSNHFW